NGSDVVPGHAEESRVYRRIAGLERPAMPAQGTPLTPAEIAVVKRWIDEGAVWESKAAPTATTTDAAALAALENRPITAAERDHWAFKLPVQAPPPLADSRLASPVDRFLDRDRRTHRLTAAPRADPHTLARPAHLDAV